MSENVCRQLLTLGAIFCARLTVITVAVVAESSPGPIDLAALDAILPTTLPPFNLTAEQIADYDALMGVGSSAEYDSDGASGGDGDVDGGEDTRSFLCIPILRIFSVEVRRPLQRGERVAIAGDHARLGAWQVDRALAMKPGWLGAQNTWSLKVPICTDKRLHYRYFIYSESGRGKRRVQEWEGVPYGRVLEKYHMYRSVTRDVFGVLSPLVLGDVERERGWLRYEYAIEFKFSWAQQLRFYHYLNLNRRQKLLLRMAPYRNGAPVPTSEWGYTQLEVSQQVYNRSQFRAQPERGVRYVDGDIVVFRFTESLRAKHSYAYQLTVATAAGYLVGEVLILALDTYVSEGVLHLSIQSPVYRFQVGTLTLPYVIIRPLQGATTFNLRGSFQRYWPMNWPPMDVGRRGMGASFGSDVRQSNVENTISSYLRAYALNADMLELDVQLTRDYVPVVWHDFGFKSAPEEYNVHWVNDLQDVLVKDLTYKQLKSRRVFAIEYGEIYEYTRYNEYATNVRERIFPTLRQVYEELPKSLGLNIEIKWPQLMASGHAESPQTLDKNRYVDVILQITIKYGCGRPLIFSSFDADICTMLRLKQNVFPVMFITEGESGMWEPYRDLRTRSHLAAVNFAQAANLLGTVAPASDFLVSGALLDYGLDLAQAVFVWGDELHDGQLVAQFKRWHATGVIYDRIDLYGPRDKRDSFFNETELQDIFARQCIVVGHTNCSSEASTAIKEGIEFDLHGKPVSRRGCEVIVRRHG